MIRFDLDMDGSMEPSEQGQWVLYEDAQRTWVDLTDEQMWGAYTGGSDIINLDYAKSIVALFKEKNT